MIAVDREDWNGHVDIWVLVVDVIECTGKLLAGITEHLQLARFLAIAVHAQASHDLIHGLAGWLVLMEEIAREKNHVDVTLLGEAHDLVEGLPAVVATDCIAFAVADMIVCGDKDTNGVGRCLILAKCNHSCGDRTLTIGGGRHGDVQILDTMDRQSRCRVTAL